MDIRGSNALVTGASRGIGKSIAEALVAAGAKVWGTSRNPSGASWPEGVVPLALDLADPIAIEGAWRSQGMGEIGFDIVVNNAGSGAFGRFDELDFETLKAQIDTLLIGTMKLSRLAWPGLKKRKGYLVNVSSLAVEFPVPFMSGYNAGKAGLSAFTESLIIEAAGEGLSVIDFRLGDFNTSFNESVVRKTGKNINTGCVDTVWGTIEKRNSQSPPPKLAAEKLVKCINRDRSGTIRSGTFFQSILAPFLSRISPLNLVRFVNLSYYGLQRRK